MNHRSRAAFESSAVTASYEKRCLAAVLMIGFVTVFSGCSPSTAPPANANWATITLISGANQTVTVNPQASTYLPQLIVVRVDSLGKPKPGALIQVSVTMNGEVQQQPNQSFATQSDGLAHMRVLIRSTPGPVSIIAEYAKCKTTGFSCPEFVTFASVSVPGIVAQ